MDEDGSDRRDLPREIDRQNSKDASIRLVLAAIGLVLFILALAYMLAPLLMHPS